MARIEAFPNVAWNLECLARRRCAVASLRAGIVGNGAHACPGSYHLGTQVVRTVPR
ncbi:MAG: hypothetical protein JWS10_3660 [Cypionkella sp.]|nr:hypothetical protein [Cypionkella sp.]